MSRKDRRKREDRARRERSRAPGSELDGGEEARGTKSRGAAEEWIRSAIVAIILFLVIRTFLVQTYVITSGSMEDSLLVGDFLMVNRVAMGSQVPFTTLRIPGYSEPRRGDVLVFDPTHEEDLMLVKRLVGMPGDTLEMRDKVLFVNGEAQEEPYVKHLDPGGDDRHPWMNWQRAYVLDHVSLDDYAPTRDTWGPIAIPEGYYFMLGDNRDHSLDARYWGLLERWRLEGRASFFYFSYDRASPRPFSFIREIRWNRIGRSAR
jgi:signal peptidase I